MSVSFAVAPGLARLGAPAAAAPPDPVGGETLLLVEDDRMVAQVLTQVLRRMHWRVLWAGDAAEAERLLAQDRAAIALVDCGLPDADGAGLCRRLRAIPSGLPVLLSSGREQSGIVQTLAADGPAAFIRKPFLPAEVTRQVQHLLARAA